MWREKILIISLLFIFAGCKEDTLLKIHTSPWIAFSSYRDGNAEIYLMNLERRDSLIRLTSNPRGDILSSWSPDGMRICFVSNRDGNDEIYVMDADGKNQERLTNNRAGNSFPSWSPDGKKIILSSIRDGNAEIYLMDADGRNQENLTNHPSSDACPCWSPDGKKIVFCSNRESKHGSAIYLMDVEKKNVQRLTYNEGSYLYPRWSPDGKKIVFCSDNGSKDYEIYIMDADGKNQKRLTKSKPIAIIENKPPGYYPRNMQPCFSPDGKWIIFKSDRDGNGEIYIMDDRGRNHRNLTNHPELDWFPAWRPVPKEE